MKNKEKYIGSVAILVLSVIFLIVGLNVSKPKEVEKNNEDIFVETKTNKSEFKKSSFKNIMVDIKGAVKKPGVYKLTNISRVIDLVQMAGGFQNNADLNRVHLSKKLNDEDMIYIYKNGEKNNVSMVVNNTTSQTSNKASHNDEGSSKKINLNTATLEELKTLPGVGEVTAKKIIEYREKNGGFSCIDDLKKIDRIGEKTVNKLRDKVDI
ncbi:helix-hairpin-helix domain-containing protein [Haloimpatiens sp. FM7330]|uniref:helix-hairpin-helix domain-containing protein n=1 Tax=Haloimpatiens sp. FM7330 TaxID=3298610 RepID=UPI003632C309